VDESAQSIYNHGHTGYDGPGLFALPLQHGFESGQSCAMYAHQEVKLARSDEPAQERCRVVSNESVQKDRMYEALINL
jgi:hypothetical protein